jgi:hypothetical protein
MGRYDLNLIDTINGDRILLPGASYGYQDLDDNIQHVCSTGDNLIRIAIERYTGVIGGDHPEIYYAYIGDFQPEPIHDPTINLEIGRTIYIPSSRTILNDIEDESRRPEFQNR